MGRFEDQGGAKMFTTPNTIYVPPEYEIEIDYPDNPYNTFLGCSLNGKLWLFNHFVIALKYNSIEKKLEFAEISNIDASTNKLVIGITSVIKNKIVYQLS